MLDHVDIDTRQPPFDLLDAAAQERLKQSVDLVYYAQGAEILAAETEAAQAFVIAKGHVEAYDPRGAGGERAFADLGPGDLFGSHAVLSGRARHSYRAAEDTLCYTIPAAVFRDLANTQVRFGAWFREGMAVKRRHRSGESTPEGGRLLMTRVADAHLAPLERLPASASIGQVTRRLREAGVDCLLVEDALAGPGIVTRTDLLEALALRGRHPDDAVGPLAKRPLITVARQAPLYQALVTMTERHIERVVVRDGEEHVGTLGMAELLSHYSASSHLIVLEIGRAASIGQVAAAARRLPELIDPLFQQGAKMRFLMELVTALNGRILRRLYELTVPEAMRDRLGLLVLGSEGRGEQLLRTDQDNALVLADGLDDAEVAPVAEALSQAIEACGWPPCPGGVMVRNTAWRGTAGTWRERIVGWIAQPTPEAMLNLAILVDARPVAGNAALVEPVLTALRQSLGQDVALRAMADQAVRFHTPLSWFGRIKGGEAGTDLKKGAIFPMVHGLRTLALQAGIAERNSFARADALVAAGALSAELGRDLQQALAVCLRLRLGEQLKAKGEGVPDNRVHVDQLRRLDRELLRDALRVVNDFQDHLRHRFRLD